MFDADLHNRSRTLKISISRYDLIALLFFVDRRWTTTGCRFIPRSTRRKCRSRSLIRKVRLHHRCNRCRSKYLWRLQPQRSCWGRRTPWRLVSSATRPSRLLSSTLQLRARIWLLHFGACCVVCAAYRTVLNQRKTLTTTALTARDTSAPMLSR